MSDREIPIDEWGYPEIDYDDLVREAAGEWANMATFGSYQGDYLYLFRDDGRVGYLIVGFGSCSGCDWLEDVVGYGSWARRTETDQEKLRADLDNMVETFRNGVRWFDSDEALVDSIWGDNDANYWFRHEADFRKAMDKVLAGEEVDVE